MIARLRRVLGVQYNYTNPIDRLRAEGLVLLILGSSLVFAVWIPILIIVSLSSGEKLDSLVLIGAATSPIAIAVTYNLIQRGLLKMTSWFIVGYLIAITAFQLPQNGLTETVMFLTLIAAGLLLDRVGVFITSAVMLALLAVFAIDPSRDIDSVEAISTGLTFVVGAGLFLLLGGAFNRVVLGSTEHIYQLQQIGKFAADIEKDNEIAVYSAAMDVARNSLGYVYAHIYLTNEMGQIARRVRSGPNLTDDTSLSDIQVGEANALSEAVRQSRPITVSLQDIELRRAHLLPSVNIGAAVPIISGSSVIGVLDVQTTGQGFSEWQVKALMMLADEVAALVGNTRTIRVLEQDLAQQQEAVTGLRAELNRYRQTERQTVGSVWDTYMQRRGYQAVGFDLMPNGSVTPAYDLPDTLHPALQKGEAHIERQGDAHIINMPIILRGEVLGAMAFTVPPGHPLTDRQVEMARGVADRLALALENRRLYEQSQAQVAREQKASEAAALLISATDVEAVINLAADSFNRALGAVRTRIQLQPDILSETPARQESPESEETR